MNNFKALPLVPVNDVPIALKMLKDNQPVGDNIMNFIKYFESTWMSTIYPIELWNHYDTHGPRTNNHVEGDNAALNRFVNVESPNVYDLILCMKDIETSVAVKYFKNKDSNFPQKRRQEDMDRDFGISIFKRQYANDELKLYGYLQKISSLFNFTDAKVPAPIINNDPLDRKAKLNQDLKAQIMILYNELQKTNYNGQQLVVGFLKPNVKVMLNHMIEKVYRRQDTNALFNPSVHQIATKYKQFLQNNQHMFYEPVLTTADGNCFYHAVSLQLFGHEHHSERLRLVNAYVLCQYELYFRDVCLKTCTSYTYERLVEQTTKNGTWANEMNMLAMSIVLNRPIAIWSHNLHKKVTHTLVFAVPNQYNNEHLNIILQDNHFTSLNSLTSSYKFPLLPNVSSFYRFLLYSLI